MLYIILIVFFLKSILADKISNITNKVVKGNNFENKGKYNVSYFFLHIHKAGGKTIHNNLMTLLKYEYWIASEASYKIIYNNDLFPSSKPLPLVFTFLRNPADQFIASYQYQSEIGFVNNQKYILNNIDECMRNKTCVEFYANRQTREVREENFDLENKFFFLGIFEYFDASFCMLRYKLGYYSENLCKCKCRYKLKENIGSVDHHVSHSINASILSNSTHQLILQNVEKDIQLYQLGLHYFHREVEKLQKSTGIDFLCLTNTNHITYDDC